MNAIQSLNGDKASSCRYDKPYQMIRIDEKVFWKPKIDALVRKNA